MKKEYNENVLFDNELIERAEGLSAFSLEAMVRSAAQRMIQAALEAEVSEFLQRLQFEKVAENFRGYRGRSSSGADGFDSRWRLESESSASFGQLGKVSITDD